MKGNITINGHILDELTLCRDQLYEAIPTGEVDAFALIKVIQQHIANLDLIDTYYRNVQSDMALEKTL